MRWLEDSINALTDMDWQWYPYLSLRPEKHETMDSLYLCKVTAYYAPVFGVFSVLLMFILPGIYFLGIPSPIRGLVVSLIFFAVLFFLGMRLIVAPAWNSRAKRLNKTKREFVVTG